MPQESAESEVRVRARERSHLDARSCHRADTPTARRSHRRSGATRPHGCGDPRGIRLARRDRVEDLRPRAPGDLEVRPGLRHAPGLGRGSQQVRRARPDLGNRVDVLPGAPDRRPRVDRDRALRGRACAARHPPRDRDAGRAAGGDSERRAGAVGHPRAWTFRRRARGAVAALARRLHPAVRRFAGERRDPDRRPGPDDHGRPDLLEHLPGALLERPDRARGGSARARGDPLGDGARGRAPIHALGRERRADPRPRPCGGRGDRGHDGDGRGIRDPLVALPDRRYVGKQDRGPVPGRREQHPARLARVPRRDPARDLVVRERRGPGDRPPLLVPAGRGKLMAADAGRYTLSLSRRTKRRKAVNLVMQGVATVAALSAVAVLAVVIASVAERGAGALSWDFFTKTAATFGQSGGGVVYGLLVVGSGQAAWKGSFALAIIMLPLVARSTQEVLALVPASLREGALALGASRWRAVLGVVLPTSLGGILTGTILAVARAAGETAPLLFVTSIAANTVTWDPRQPVLSIPVDIFALSESPDPADHARAWALALVLISFILVASLTARAAFVRYRSRLER